MVYVLRDWNVKSIFGLLPQCQITLCTWITSLIHICTWSLLFWRQMWKWGKWYKKQDDAHIWSSWPQKFTHIHKGKKKKKIRAEKWGYKMLRSVEIHKTHERGFEWTNFRRKFLNARMLAHMFVKMFAYEKSETLVLLKMWYALSFKITMFKSTWLSKIP